MGRIAINLDKEDLLRKLNEVESNNPPKNRSELFERLALIFKVSNSTILNKMKEMGLLSQIKTPLGKRGSGVPLSPEHKLSMRQGRLVKTDNPANERAIKDLAKAVGPKMAKLVEKVKAGSKSAAIKLKCIDCSGNIDENGKLPIQNIKSCPCIDCALWTLRPYQEKTEEANAD